MILYDSLIFQMSMQSLWEMEHDYREYASWV